MGYDLRRFHGEVDEELICPICSGVLEEPLQAPQCEHAFCRICIHEWLTRQQTCPVDRTPITPLQLKSVPRILRNLLSRLLISCDNSTFGCAAVVKLDRLSSHLEGCEHNPRRPVQCEQGCGLVVPMDELKDHNCIKELRALVESQQQKMKQFQQELSEQKREINMLKEHIHSFRLSSPSVPSLMESIGLDEISRWSSSLQRARVTRWGGMISTPDIVLQAMVKRALSESGCPPHIINDLMENAHERRWPPGLSTLETRQTNRRQYENYVCKRIPGKQAVVVMTCDNSHMNADMLLNPGLVMIFAHGIE
ncbi:E3 ubiquitin-protein ligase NRDP1-like [Limulus polyphemus]|uniref:E3 ubiquitin-protein ligase NRDP1 n=1 Tax=Limulus polyphemus TaxID=6850 RepID=A0ABM1BNC7_LIMPO|nr:E3 ubiquitin-protein ligase NRDP1-like [Limulus polyphemus]